MNKKLSMLLPVIATCGLLAGCGTDYYTKDSTVFVAKNGSVVSTDVEDFDTAAYKQDDLQSYVDKSIDDYNKKNDGSVKLKKLTVEKKKASLTPLQYRELCLLRYLSRFRMCQGKLYRCSMQRERMRKKPQR